MGIKLNRALALAVLTVATAIAVTAQTDPRAGFEVAAGLDLTVFATEPQVMKPTNISVDDRGRVWALESRNYRQNFLSSRIAEGDRIVILVDTNGDGRADRETTFYQGPDVNAALGIAVLGDKVYVSAYENVFVFTNRDDRPVKKEVLFRAQTGNSDHSTHAFVFGPDGRLYWNSGNSTSRIMDASGRNIVDLTGREVTPENFVQGKAYRLNEDGSRFEVIGHNFRNNFELTVDSFGTVWQSDNDDDGNASVRINYVMEYGNFGYIDPVDGSAWRQPRYDLEEETTSRHWHQNTPGVVPNLLATGAGSPAGILTYEGTLLPAPFRNQVIHAEPGWNVVRSYPVVPRGAGYSAEIVNIAHNVTNMWFRPSDVAVAPDGSLFIADWSDPGVGGHRQGDQTQGRIYRVAPKGHAYRPASVATDSLPAAIEALKSPNQAVFYRAWHSLADRGAQAEASLRAVFEDRRPENTRFRARALWLLARIPGRTDAWIRQALRDAAPDIRVTALRAARQNAASVLPYVEVAVRDENAAIRREAAIALRGVKDPQAADLWATLAQAHDGRDRWYLEALGIGADGQWPAYFRAWKTRVGNRWNTPGGRDIVWRSRAEESLPLLSTLMGSADTDTRERPRYFRALDFYPAATKQEILRRLLAQVANSAVQSTPRADGEIAALALFGLDMDPAAITPEIRTALNRALDGTNGTPRFLELVQRFELKDRATDLVTMALKDPTGNLGKEAARLAINLVSPVPAAAGRGAAPVAGAGAGGRAGGAGAAVGAPTDGRAAGAGPAGGAGGAGAGGRGAAAPVDPQPVIQLFAPALRSSNPVEVKKAILLLGAADLNAARQVLRDLMLDASQPEPLRVEAVRALGVTRGGETLLLSVVSSGGLPPSLKPAAASVLFASYTAATRAEAAKYLTPPTPPGGATSSATAGTLAAQQGDAASGAAIFTRVCTACHQIDGNGVAFGPDLSQIGSKLAKQAIFAKILQPSGGVAFGYEGYVIKLKNGEELAAYIESETAQQVSLRVIGGVTRRIATSEIASKEMMTGSLMPTGLASAMSEKELVDLVAYLSSKKGQAATGSVR